MAKIVPWSERKFEVPYPVELLPELLVRLRGTAIRVDEMTRGITPPELLTSPAAERKWSAQQHIGHLADMEYLYQARVKDFLNGADVLTEGDLSNKKTGQARHNETPLREIIAQFRNYRKQTLSLVERLPPTEFERTAKHPGRGVTLRMIDQFHMIAEHDDHHLAIIYSLVHPVHTGG